MKKMYVLGPALPQWSEIRFIADTLKFLHSYYELVFFDSVVLNKEEEGFIEIWREEIQRILQTRQYSAFLGFSLGGVILQHCFDLIEPYKKSVILFSTPSFADHSLSYKLSNVIKLLEENSFASAIEQHNLYVFYPQPVPHHISLPEDTETVTQRLLKGLKFLLNVDSRHILEQSRMTYLHLFGELSPLVNWDNVIASASARLMAVPNSGMRVLQDNPDYCVPRILQFLEEASL